MEIISKLFSPSPFCHLRDHASETGACLRRLQCLVEATLSDDREGADGHLKEIQSRVLVGRAIADELFQILSRRVMLAVRREDIISTIEAQNSMLCACGEFASLISARALPLHDDTRQQLRTYIREVLEFSILATDVIANVDVLVEVCFAGPEADKVGLLIDEIRRRMTKTDLLRNRLVQTLFSPERDDGPSVHSFCLSLLAEMRNIASLADKLASRCRLFCPHRGSPVHAGRRDTTGDPNLEKRLESGSSFSSCAART
jgi:predicted phosphate transport protein (TIGR00153 family)